MHRGLVHHGPFPELSWVMDHGLEDGRKFAELLLGAVQAVSQGLGDVRPGFLLGHLPGLGDAPDVLLDLPDGRGVSGGFRGNESLDGPCHHVGGIVLEHVVPKTDNALQLFPLHALVEAREGGPENSQDGNGLLSVHNPASSIMSRNGLELLGWRFFSSSRRSSTQERMAR